ncbi:MAG: site-specific DNA-methyltransferase [Herpetosiphonaceae bacterium]|nr:site-specific DNA-methyltransferase [Herpetosiphonaceae bacterium]
MSRLTDLIAQVKTKDPTLGSDLEAEFRVLSERRVFGLNFERHRPEAVELPQRPVRKGDKVHILPPRRSTGHGDQRLWRVLRTEVGGTSSRIAHLTLLDGDETQTVPVDDLVVVAEFRDTIYPGLRSTGRVEHDGDKPYHTVINAENYHALQTLLYTHRGKVDCIYIDPPYNTGAKDWKYNNDYVDGEDIYRHSKWLAFMERRLLLAKELLNPVDSVLIVTIDERECLRLGLLLEQTFSEATIQMVTSVISAKGAVRPGRFSRVEEHIFIITFGSATISHWSSNMLPSYREEVNNGQESYDETADSEPAPAQIEWLGLRRREPSSIRGSRPNQFYPIFVNIENGSLHSIGAPLPDDLDRNSIVAPSSTVALWPLKPDGTEMLWGLTPEVLRRNWAHGFARVNWNPKRQTGTVYYLPSGTIERIRSGTIAVTGRSDDGSVQGHATSESSVRTPPKRVWNMQSHNAETGGTNILSRLIPKRSFPYPKSLYAVEDVLRFFVKDKPSATAIDFFAGSGTTAHAVMRLNRQDGGRRQCISVTNNEVSADEQGTLRREGLRPGDLGWERWGICDYITKPRIEAAITGRTPAGDPIKGDYKFTDEFPMAEGFEENVEFFTLTYETPWRVARNRDFAAIAPLLWLRAGAQGCRIDTVPDSGWAVADRYAVLVDLDQAKLFLNAVADASGVRIVFIVTDDDRRFQMVCSPLPDQVEPVRLYESYLANFEINTGRE